MGSPLNAKGAFAADEDVQTKLPQQNEHIAQVSPLPFSVEALMSDSRPQKEVVRQQGGKIPSEGNSSSNSRESYSLQESHSPTSPVKSETVFGDCASWMSRVKLSPPSRKYL